MKLHYHPTADSLFVQLSEGEGTTAREISPGVIADFDVNGRVVGLDICLANGGLDGGQLETIALLSVDNWGERPSHGSMRRFAGRSAPLSPDAPPRGLTISGRGSRRRSSARAR